jgi:hypothetical protein
MTCTVTLLFKCSDAKTRRQSWGKSTSGRLSAPNGGGVWLSGQPTPLLVAKDGYGDPAACPPGFSCRAILINGDTRFDIELVRR